MAFVSYAFLLLQLSLLLSSTVYGHETIHISQSPAEAPHHHHHKYHHHHAPTPAPSSSPIKPPVHPPVNPPTPTPTSPPSHPPVKPPTKPLPVRKLLAVRGTVYCKPCNYKGVNTLMHAAPLHKAVVKLQCNNTKYGMVEQTETDENGFFIFRPKKVTTMAFHKCKVFLVSSPVSNCTVPTNLHSGAAGAILIPDHKPPVATALVQYFNVGPFAFDSSLTKCY